MIRMIPITASTAHALVVAAAMLAASIAAPTGSTAQAQTPGADVRPGTLLPAPVGHLQPRRTRVPAVARQMEDHELSSERTFDRQLDICRGC